MRYVIRKAYLNRQSIRPDKKEATLVQLGQHPMIFVKKYNAKYRGDKFTNLNLWRDNKDS